MQVSILQASRGARWLVEGFSIFRQKPVLLSFLVLGYWLSMGVISAVPVIGQLVGFLMIPAFSVSLMNACRLVERKADLPPQVLFSGFHRNLQALVTLGVIYVIVTLAILGLSALFDGGTVPYVGSRRHPGERYTGRDRLARRGSTHCCHADSGGSCVLVRPGSRRLA